MVTLLADVATNYVKYRIAQQRLQVARQNLESQQRLVNLAEQQQRAGTATELDVYQLRTLMERTASSISVLENVRGQANDRRSILLVEPPHELEPELGAGPARTVPPLPNVPTSVAVGIPVDLLRRRPDVRAVERRVAAQSAMIGVAESELYPSLSVSTLLGHSDFSFSSLATSGGTSLIVPQFSWKVLNYGRLLNNVRLQVAKTQELIAAYQSQVLAAAQETQTALRAFLQSQQEAQHLAVSAAAQRLLASLLAVLHLRPFGCLLWFMQARNVRAITAQVQALPTDSRRSCRVWWATMISLSVGTTQARLGSLLMCGPPAISSNGST